ncbi:MAG: hypothetical protein ACFFDF_17225 [Candidatus Odinarchaeota archaeon]
MRILIKQIEKGIYVQEEDRITSFDIIGQFKNGIHISIKDNVPYDLRKFSSNEIECLLLANLSKFPDDISSNYKPSHIILEGTYMGEYSISEKWKVDGIYQLDPNWHDFNYHAIQTENGIIIVRSNKLINYKIMEGEKFKFKVIDFELMAWKPISGEKEIDPLAYEKNFIEKFWNLIESTREKCNNDSGLQKDLIYKALLEWSYDEIWLFGDIVNHLSNALRFDTILKGLFKKEVNKWGNFCRGIVALGRKPFNEAISNLAKFSHDINTGVYGESPKKIESSLYTLVQDVVEEKSGKTIYDVEELYLREDIDDYQQRIYEILDKDHNLNWESD